MLARDRSPRKVLFARLRLVRIAAVDLSRVLLGRGGEVPVDRYCAKRDLRAQGQDEPGVDRDYAQADKRFAGDVVRTLMNDNGKHYVDDGKFAVKNQTPEMKEIFKGTERTTNKNEGLYGNVKYTDRHFTNISMFNACAVACAQRYHIFPNIAGQYFRTKNLAKRKYQAGLIDGADENTKRAYVLHVVRVERKIYRAQKHAENSAAVIAKVQNIELLQKEARRADEVFRGSARRARCISDHLGLRHRTLGRRRAYPDARRAACTAQDGQRAQQGVGRHIPAVLSHGPRRAEDTVHVEDEDFAQEFPEDDMDLC